MNWFDRCITVSRLARPHSHTTDSWLIEGSTATHFLPSGRDVSNGTFRIDAARHAFVRAARKLEALARGRRMTDGSINYLSVRGRWFFKRDA